jgi:hypothetical protein
VPDGPDVSVHVGLGGRIESAIGRLSADDQSALADVSDASPSQKAAEPIPGNAPFENQVTDTLYKIAVAGRLPRRVVAAFPVGSGVCEERTKKRRMSVVRVLLCSLGGALGLLLVATTPFAPDDVTTDVVETAPRETSPGLGETNKPEACIDTPSCVDETAPRETSPGLGETNKSEACIDMPSCVDGYLWSIYQRTPTTFGWKDAEAAERIGMSPMEFVIGGMDPAFRVALYRALRTLDDAGFKPGITCGFRNDYRQSIITNGKKAQNDRSFHGGSARGGYGHGAAADIVSVNGGDSDRMYEWIDRHEQKLGIGRPYLKGDPPHVAPLDGEEYIIHRIGGRPRQAAPRSSQARQAGAQHRARARRTAVAARSER